MEKLMFFGTLLLVASFLTVQALSQEVETEISIISTGYITYKDYDLKVLNATNKTVLMEIKRGATNSSHNLTVGNLTDFPSLGFAIKVNNVTTISNQLIANSLIGPDIKTREVLLRPSKAYMATTHQSVSVENRSFKVVVAYSENTTGLFRLISDARCTVIFDDDPFAINMTFVAESGYEYSRIVLEDSIGYNTSCSHPKFTYENQTMKIEIKKEATEVVLIEPTGTLTSRDVTFICEVRGEKPEKINLYSDTSGEWTLTGTASVLSATSPFRVSFFESGIADGSYKWNCEAVIGSTKPRALVEGRFTVKFSPPNLNCTESVDCADWKPDTCPSRGRQTRLCNNTEICGYDTVKTCTQEPVVIASPSPDVVVTSPSTTPKPPKPGTDMTMIIIIAVVVVVGIIVIFILKRRKGGDNLEDLGRDDYREDEFGEEPGGGFGEGGEDENRGY